MYLHVHTDTHTSRHVHTTYTSRHVHTDTNTHMCTQTHTSNNIYSIFFSRPLHTIRNEFLLTTLQTSCEFVVATAVERCRLFDENCIKMNQTTIDSNSVPSGLNLAIFVLLDLS